MDQLDFLFENKFDFIFIILFQICIIQMEWMF